MPVIDMDTVRQRAIGSVGSVGSVIRHDVDVGSRGLMQPGGRGPVVDEEKDGTPGEKQKEGHRREAKRGESDPGRCDHVAIRGLWMVASGGDHRFRTRSDDIESAVGVQSMRLSGDMPADSVEEIGCGT